MAVKFSNNGKTTLASNITSSATSISVTDGSVFPTLGSGDYFYLTFENSSSGVEIVKVTNLTGNTLTVERAQENTTASAYASGDRAELRLTVGGITDSSGTSRFYAKAGEAISKGQAVYISGNVSSVPVVSLANASDANKMPAFGLADSDLANNEFGYVVSYGELSGIDTATSLNLHDTLYVSATTAGAITTTAPSGEGNLIQNMGVVVRENSNNGSVKVGGAGRSNAAPNLNDGNIFIGNSSNKAVTASLGTEISSYLSSNDISTGNITVSGTVDGRDVAADGTKLDGIASGAEVNVNADWNATSGDAQILNKPTIPTNNNQLTNGAGYATESYVNTSVSNLVDSAPSTLDTLNELAAALGDDANFSTTVTNSIATKLPLAGGTLTGNLSFGDNNKAIFGAGSDLQIYHDGSHSYITDVGTGNLRLQGDNLVLQNSDATKNYAVAVNGGAIDLRHNNSVKLATTATGIDVTGTITADGLSLTGNGTSLSLLGLTQSIAGGNSNLKIGSSDAAAADKGGQLNFTANTTTLANYPVAGIHGYHETLGAGNYSGYLSLFTTATGGAITERIRIDSSGVTTFKYNTKVYTGGYPETRLGISDSNYFNFTFDNPSDALSIGKNSSTKMTLTASGRLGIGTSLPASSLHIVDSGLATQLRISNTTADATTKYGTVLGSHYTNSEEPVAGMLLTSSSSSNGNTVSIGGGISTANAANQIVFYTTANKTTLTGTERMRIDSGGRLSVGTTSSFNDGAISALGSGRQAFTAKVTNNANSLFQGFNSSGTAVIQAVGTGDFYATRMIGTKDGAAPAILDRLTSDGDIALFRKDGATVGSIGTVAGDIVIGTGTAGLRFWDSGPAIQPRNSDGSANNDAIDLGISTSRFKDLYLSGAAYVNGNTVWHSGNDASGSGLDADTLDGYQLDGSTSIATRIFNNKGRAHGAVNNFNTAMTPGPNYLQGNTNGPGSGNDQWYGLMFGLGSEYGTTTGTSGHYAAQMYFKRNASSNANYLHMRSMESGSWGSWLKVSAGYADSAGSAGNADTVDGLHGTDLVETSNGASSDLNTNLSAQMFGFNTGTANRPQNYGQGLTIVSDGKTQNNSSNWATQIAFGTDENSMYFRGKTNAGSWNSWQTVWHTGNDGSGSGLDADLLDGLDSTAFARVDQTAAIKSFNSTLTINSYTRIARITGNSLSTAVRAYFSGTASNIVVNAFADILVNHTGDIQISSNSSDYTTLTLKVEANGDNEDYDLYAKHTAGTTTLTLITTIHSIGLETITPNPTATAYSGGTSAEHAMIQGGLRYSQSSSNVDIYSDGDYYSGSSKVWHAGNDGAGSGLDADLLDGYHASTTRNAANTIPIRDVNGYLQLGWINTTSGATTSTIDRIYASSDSYIRYVTPATLISQLGLWTSGND